VPRDEEDSQNRAAAASRPYVCYGQGYEARLVLKRLRLTVRKPVSSKGNGYVKQKNEKRSLRRDDTRYLLNDTGLVTVTF